MVSAKEQKATKYLFEYPALLSAASACISLCRSGTRTVRTKMSLLMSCTFRLHAEPKPEAQVAVIEPELIPEPVVLEPEVLPAQEQGEEAGDWKAVVGLSALLAMICSVDRAAMSVALGPMVRCRSVPPEWICRCVVIERSIKSVELEPPAGTDHVSGHADFAHCMASSAAGLFRITACEH